ncbi:MAG: UDP-N-acetylmuramoyl-L-alanine--D-glutamate ligase, partial [Clostridia bacterium]|nr:UDP-N-acetylmuramoyl-L-alanine--D-glutamate ligase [Clostridia bacterium]
DDVTVCEISSFMMETSKEFHPHVAAVLNISEDHMDRHHTMACYIGLKERIFEKCTADDFVVLNYEDACTRDMANRAAAKAGWFSSRNEVPYGAFVKDGNVVFGTPEDNTVICAANEIYIPGEHNLQNALAATAMAMVSGVSAEIIAETLRSFQGVEHRIEFTRVLNGITFYNDSKGTNVDSTIQAVRAMKKPTVLILGGYDKHCDFTPLVEIIKQNPISHIMLIGATAKQIADTLDKCGYTSYEHCGTDFEKCVRLSYERAEADGNVLFSPSCASFDMFTDYESRGRIFKDLVNKL